LTRRDVVASVFHHFPLSLSSAHRASACNNDVSVSCDAPNKIRVVNAHVGFTTACYAVKNTRCLTMNARTTVAARSASDSSFNIHGMGALRVGNGSVSADPIQSQSINLWIGLNRIESDPNNQSKAIRKSSYITAKLAD